VASRSDPRSGYVATPRIRPGCHT